MIQCPVESSLECTYVCFSSGLKCTLGIKRYEVLSFSTQTQHTYTTHKPMPHTHTLVRHIHTWVNCFGKNIVQNDPTFFTENHRFSAGCFFTVLYPVKQKNSSKHPYELRCRLHFGVILAIFHREQPVYVKWSLKKFLKQTPTLIKTHKYMFKVRH